jgi:hypothetical protein
LPACCPAVPYFSTYLPAADGSALRAIALHGAAAEARYLYLLPGPTGAGNGHLLWKAQVTHMPEPSALVMLSVGLAALGFAARKRSA